MRKVRLAVLVAAVLFASLAVGQTNRWVSDGTENVVKPDDVEIDVEEIEPVPSNWGGGLIATPTAYAKLAEGDGGAVWIGIDDEGLDLDYTGYFVYKKYLGNIIPSGTVHSRLTFWGCADDRIVSVSLIAPNYPVQTFYPENNFAHIERLVRLDMTDATIAAGVNYDMWVTVRNQYAQRTGVIFYLSVDYASSDEMYFYTWQGGWDVHSLPFRPTAAYDQLIDLFPSAHTAMYWEQDSSTWKYMDLTATLTGHLGDIVRSHSFYVLHLSHGYKIAYGYPIYEQRYLDMWPGGGVSQFRDIGTVSCNIPFDWSDPSYEPDDWPDMSIDTAWYYDQGSGYTETYEIDAFGGSPNAIGYRIHCFPTGSDDRCNVDLRCPSLLLSSPPVIETETPPEELERIIKFKRDHGYDVYEISEASSDTASAYESREDIEPTPLEYEPMPFPPGYFLKAATDVPSEQELSVRATPNPFNSTVEISVTVPEDTDNISVTIYDINGKLIKELQSSEGNTFRWDGTDQKGDICPTGAYLYKAKCGDHTVTDNILYMK